MNSQPFESNWNLDVWRIVEPAAMSLPKNFPASAEIPKYMVGDRCRWIPMTTTDWGTIIGRVFIPVQTGPRIELSWSWLYFIFLDEDSPSRAWVIADWAAEDDIEPLPLRADSESDDLENLP